MDPNDFMIQVIDRNEKFIESSEKDFADLAKQLVIEESCRGSSIDRADNYHIITIFGSQSSGKSTLLNNIFQTHFPVLDASAGRCQTTRGVWASINKIYDVKKENIADESESDSDHESSSSSSVSLKTGDIMVFDCEGTDSVERGEHKRGTERRISLFAVALADVIVFNLFEVDIGRADACGYSLLSSVFTGHADLFGRTAQKTKLVVVIRDFTGKTPLEYLSSKLEEDFINLWDRGSGTKKPEHLSGMSLQDFFSLEFIPLPSAIYRESEYFEAVQHLRERFIDPTHESYIFRYADMSPTSSELGDKTRDTLDHKYLSPRVSHVSRHRRVPLSTLGRYVSNVWSTICAHKELNIPSERALLIRSRANEISRECVVRCESEYQKLERILRKAKERVGNHDEAAIRAVNPDIKRSRDEYDLSEASEVSSSADASMDTDVMLVALKQRSSSQAISGGVNEPSIQTPPSLSTVTIDVSQPIVSVKHCRAVRSALLSPLPLSLSLYDSKMSRYEHYEVLKVRKSMVAEMDVLGQSSREVAVSACQEQCIHILKGVIQRVRSSIQEFMSISIRDMTDIISNSALLRLFERGWGTSTSLPDSFENEEEEDDIRDDDDYSEEEEPMVSSNKAQKEHGKSYKEKEVKSKIISGKSSSSFAMKHSKLRHCDSGMVGVGVDACQLLSLHIKDDHHKLSLPFTHSTSEKEWREEKVRRDMHSDSPEDDMLFRTLVYDSFIQKRSDGAGDMERSETFGNSNVAVAYESYLSKVIDEVFDIIHSTECKLPSVPSKIPHSLSEIGRCALISLQESHKIVHNWLHNSIIMCSLCVSLSHVTDAARACASSLLTAALYELNSIASMCKESIEKFWTSITESSVRIGVEEVLCYGISECEQKWVAKEKEVAQIIKYKEDGLHPIWVKISEGRQRVLLACCGALFRDLYYINRLLDSRICAQSAGISVKSTTGSSLGTSPSRKCRSPKVSLAMFPRSDSLLKLFISLDLTICDIILGAAKSIADGIGEKSRKHFDRIFLLNSDGTPFTFSQYDVDERYQFAFKAVVFHDLDMLHSAFLLPLSIKALNSVWNNVSHFVITEDLSLSPSIHQSKDPLFLTSSALVQFKEMVFISTKQYMTHKEHLYAHAYRRHAEMSRNATSGAMKQNGASALVKLARLQMNNVSLKGIFDVVKEIPTLVWGILVFAFRRDLWYLISHPFVVLILSLLIGVIWLVCYLTEFDPIKYCGNFVISLRLMVYNIFKKLDLLPAPQSIHKLFHFEQFEKVDQESEEMKELKRRKSE
ncbi:RHD3/Sey1 like protein [Aduncisulcus paluster]|uniref:RHD3/Sey1 like protein n=1 Tax=Aduncisulcus paluster TaxID=2918883 RepID=A0ABQ5K2U1_9EUKA|nr:RHD3/Sey1 like protein [Aduncisulcus paluster]